MVKVKSDDFKTDLQRWDIEREPLSDDIFIRTPKLEFQCVINAWAQVRVDMLEM